MKTPLLRVEGLKTFYNTREGINRAVDGIDYEIGMGEVIGLVGESGCGKTVSALSIMRLIPSPPGRIETGRIELEGNDLLALGRGRMEEIRGKEISMIFQEPMTSLNPIFNIGEQISEAIRVHQGVGKKEALRNAVEMLKMVKMPHPEKRAYEYPHQLSGGMRQRAMIAMALSCGPKLLIADEPTTALDVIIQAQILELLLRLRQELGMAILLITHDLGVVAEVAERVLVMYLGKIVEAGGVRSIFHHSRHPYTIGLLGSVPQLGRGRGRGERRVRLQEIPGSVPNAYQLPKGCRFEPRCSHAIDVCRQEEPELKEIEEGHGVRCWVCPG